MNHDDAVQLTAVESYILGELPSAVRDEFEEHFFECTECAEELRLTAAFLDDAKTELASGENLAGPPQGERGATPRDVSGSARSSPRWRPAVGLRDAPRTVAPRPGYSPLAFLWRPAVLAPGFALALLVLVYQNVWVLPRDAGELAKLRRPSLPAELSFVGANSRGGAQVRKIEVAPGQPLLFSVDIPTDDRFVRYACELQDPAGKVVWRAPVTADQAKDTVPIYVPADHWPDGDYRLVVQGYGKSDTGAPVDISVYPFALESRSATR
jgi:anti-sigma factor RsiW